MFSRVKCGKTVLLTHTHLLKHILAFDFGTQRLRALCAVGEESDDGVFWMSFADFAQKFASVFVCRMTARAPVSLRFVSVESQPLRKPVQSLPRQINHSLSTRHRSKTEISICFCDK